MASWTEAHLLFCEGPHDVAFLNQVLKKQLGFNQKELQISELPYPIGNVLKQGFLNRAAEDLRLDLAKKFFLPDQVLARKDVLVLLFNYGGSNRDKSLPPFLAAVFELLNAPAFSEGDSVPLSYVVFADADAAGTAAALADISKDLAQIAGQSWLTANWQAWDKLQMAAEQQTAQGCVGAYIWRQQDADQGTLEDIVLECMGEQPRFAETLEFVDTRFKWTPAAQAKPEEKRALAAKRLKAAFCIEGQRKKPGGSLGVVLDQADLLTPERLSASVSVQHCVRFLRHWMGIENSQYEAQRQGLL